VLSVETLPNAKPIEKPKEDIAAGKKARRLIGKLKNAAGWDSAKKSSEFWMMQLQHPGGAVLQCRFAVRRSTRKRVMLRG
jgi:hypothetical protein